MKTYNFHRADAYTVSLPKILTVYEDSGDEDTAHIENLAGNQLLAGGEVHLSGSNLSDNRN